MRNFKILILTLAVIPVFVLAQTSADSVLSDPSVIGTDSTESVDRDVDVNTNDTTSETKDETTSETTAETTESDPTTYTEADTYESIKTVTDNISDITEEQKVIESELRDEIKDGIDESIIEIRSQENIEAYELQREVDKTRTDIYEDINQTLKNTAPTDIEPIKELESRVNDAFSDIEQSLENKSGVDVDFSDSTADIRETFLRYEKIIAEKKEIIDAREGDLMNKDTDEDGLSDYDEKFIYKTDPENAYTTSDDMTDAEKIISGIDPTDPEQNPINYQDPRDDQKSVISKIHKLEKIELVTKDGEIGKRLQMSGTALPNSYVTVYVFSTPTIVTVKTNARGEWSYTLDKELENGQHDVYVATVDNTGRLIARSESIPITQSDEAATLGTFGIGEPAPEPNDFVQENFVLIILAILLFAIIIVLILSGSGGGKDKDVDFIVPEGEGKIPPMPTQSTQSNQPIQPTTQSQEPVSPMNETEEQK